MSNEQLLQQAKDVLELNWVQLPDGSGFTKPAQNIYPYQWNWDSAFIAYGYTKYNLPRALTELRTLFLGQWNNGMLPHIIFHKVEPEPEETYFPSPDMWAVDSVQPELTPQVRTSGMTQPPLTAMAVWQLFKFQLKKDPKIAYQILEEFYPKLYKYHEYLHTQRDPEETGLVTIMHPWESGLDNSPRWDTALQHVPCADMAQFTRKDTDFIAKKNRPTDEEYGRYIQLLLLMKEGKYEHNVLYESFPFRIKDIVFSCILYNANKRLWRMGEVLQRDTSIIHTWMSRFESSLHDYCWNEEDKMFYDWDIVAGEQIRVHTIASLFPITTGVASDRQKESIHALMKQTDFCGEQGCAVALAPSIPLNALTFNDEQYWRGPVWINMNWFLWKGLREHHFTEQSTTLQHAMTALMKKSGLREYYSPLTAKGLGAQNFSWSAALAIDLLHYS